MATAAVPASASASLTETALGSCTNGAANTPVRLEQFTVSNPVTVSGAGVPSGQFGVSIRTRGTATTGRIPWAVLVYDLTAGRQVGGYTGPDTAGCVRFLAPLRDIGFKAVKGHVYALTASAGYLDAYSAPVTTFSQYLVALGNYLSGLSATPVTGFSTR